MSSNRPGVEITQQLATTASTVVTPALVPLIAGVCHQIVESLDSDGALDSDAVYPDAQYNQATMFIPQADFPDPRDNIDELNVDESSIGAELYFGGVLKTLDRGSNASYGSAFLKLTNFARAAALRSSENDGGTGYVFDAVTGSPFTFAFDVVNPDNVSSDITVTFVGTLLASEVVAAINLAVGSTVAEVVDISGNDYVQLTSRTYGATSSITLRAGCAALKILFGAAFADTVEYRVEGAGFRGQDDEDGDLTTPWLEFYGGAYLEDDVSTAIDVFPTANTIHAGQVNIAGTFVAALAADLIYTGTSADVPLIAATATVPGDQFWADGALAGSGEIIKVEASRFKVGRVNSSLSTYDSDGEITNRVYDTVEFNTENHGTPFTPKYAYFRAQGLVYGSILPAGEAATLTGSNQGLVERSAQVHGSSTITFPLSPASLTLIFQVTEDGVQGSEVTYTFAGGPYANAAALVAALTLATEFSQLTVTCPDDVLVLTTTKTGADQAITVKSTGTANTVLGFSAVTATSDIGKDVEFAEQATMTSDFFALPMVDLTALTFEITVVDSKGTHTVTSASTTLAAVTNLGDLTKAICEAFGSANGTTDPTIYDGGIPIATMSSSGAADTTGTITITTIEGGASVTLDLVAIDDTDGWRYLGFHDDTGGVSAQADNDGVTVDFGGLYGTFTVDGTGGFALTIVGGTNVLGATDITPAVGSYTFDQMATELETRINALAPTTVTVVWDRVNTYFTIDAQDSTSITVTAPALGTDYSNILFGTGFTSVQAATSWDSINPDQATATIALTYIDAALVSTLITGSATYAMAAETDPEALAELLNANDDFNGVNTVIAARLVEWFSADGVTVSVRGIDGGVASELTSATPQAGLDAMGFTTPLAETGTALGGNADDVGADLLKSTTLLFNLDDNPYDYSITFDTNSLQDAIDAINDLVDGSDDVASESTRALTLTSLLLGAASRVFVDTANCTADTPLGFTLTTNDNDLGAGRPNPDFYLDGDGAVYIGPNILRNNSSGIPFSLESALSDLYITYTALRLDVTAAADEPALLSLEDVTTLEAAIGPISTDNPLALGVFLALANCPTNTVSALGIDEISAAAPLGTLDGWARAIKFLESREVYTIAPLTDDEYIQGLLATHVLAMSEPEERGERILFIWSEIPTRAATITVTSGTDGVSNGNDNEFVLDENPVSDLIAQGIDPSDPIDADEGLYLEVIITTLGVSDLRRYSIAEVDGVLLTFRTSFATGENDDGFYSTATFDESVTGADWSLKIRGDMLYVTGTTIMDLNAQAAAAASQAAAYASRRVYYLACDSVDTSIDGLTTNVEGFYAAAAIAGMIAEQLPQQPFTNYPIAGLGAVYGTDDTFSERQMDVVADGGRYLLINLGGAVVARKQLSTSTTSIETKELSITKAVDYVAKGLRATNRVFIGRSVITTGFIDQLTLSNEGYLDYVEQLGVVRKATLKTLLQDPDDPDTILEEVEVDPAYPCNKIRITIIS